MSYSNQFCSLKSEKNILTASVCAVRVAKKNLPTIWKQQAWVDFFLFKFQCDDGVGEKETHYKSVKEKILHRKKHNLAFRR